MFHDTLGQALDAGISDLKSRGAIFSEESARDPFTYDGIPYPMDGSEKLPSKSSDFELESLKGKKTKKFGHVTVWRHESGKYEVNTYIL